MKNKQNEILTAIKVLIENKMYKEATELINASMLPESLFTTYNTDQKQIGTNNRCIVCGNPRGHGGLKCPDFSVTK